MNRAEVIERERATARSEEVEVRIGPGLSEHDVELRTDPDQKLGGTWFFRWPKEFPVRNGERVLAYSEAGRLIGVARANGEIVHWKVAEDRELEHERWTHQNAIDHIDRYIEHRDEMDAAIEALEDPFLQLRIDKFLVAGGLRWRWELEAYEMAAVTDAAKIAEHFAGMDIEINPDALWSEILQFEPSDIEGASPGHSGNSWDHARLLAFELLTDPPRVVLEHGAMVGLTGCADYPCPHPPAPEILERLEQLAPGWMK